jgi:hypothetical protein
LPEEMAAWAASRALAAEGQAAARRFLAALDEAEDLERHYNTEPGADQDL